MAELERQLTNALTKLIYGFYEERRPAYTQGDKQLTELHEIVTADECNGMVISIMRLEQQLAECRQERDRLKKERE